MPDLASHADALLRGQTGLAPGLPALRTLRRLLLFTVACGGAYGAAMGSFGGFGGERTWQLLFSATKVPLLLIVTFLVAIPSFFVLNTLLGVRADFGAVLRALVGAQAALTIVLVALAPYTLLWYASFGDYSGAVLFNGIIFAVASIAGQWHLRRSYRPLIARQVRHRLLLRAWLVLYIFVGIQMAWILRPFVGTPNLSPQFFRQEAWGNAYVVVARLIWQVITR